MSSALFVQCRLDSSRLPAKALFDLCGASLLDRVLENLAGIKTDRRVLVTDEEGTFFFSALAQKHEYELFAGSKNNVLKRFADALQEYPVDFVVRATADNPLVAIPMAQRCLDQAIQHCSDHVRMNGLAYGGGVEVVKAQTLLERHSNTHDLYEREHVCPGIWGQPDLYKTLVLEADLAYRRPELHVSIDTMDDYQRLLAYYAETSSPSYEDFVERNPVNENV